MKAFKIFFCIIALGSAHSISMAAEKKDSFVTRRIANFYAAGQWVGNVNVPVVGRFVEDPRLKGFLPFALIGCAFNKCPKQTAAILAGLVCFMLYHNDKVREMLIDYNIISSENDIENEMEDMYRSMKQTKEKTFDDSFFAYEGAE